MKKLFVGVMLMGPLFAFAQTGIEKSLTYINSLVTTLIPLLIGVAVLLFFWGLVKYIANASDETAKESGKTLMIWGIVAIFIMVSFWGIIGYLQSSLDVQQAVTVTAGPTGADLTTMLP